MLRRRWVRRLAIALAILTLAGGLGYALVVPRLVRAQIAGALESAGIHGAQFELGRVMPWGLQLTNLRIGDSGDRIARVSAEYSLATLWRKRVTNLRISGAHLAVSIRDGKIDFGPLEELIHRKSDGPKMLRVPAERIDIDSAALDLQLPRRTVAATATGSLVRQADARYELELNLVVDGAPVRIAGMLGPMTDRLELTVSGATIPAVAVADIAAALYPATETTAKGTLSLDGSINWSGGFGSMSGKLKPDGLAVNVRLPSDRIMQLSRVGGDIFAQASFTPGAPARGKVKLAGGTFTSRGAATSAEGISGSISFEDLANLVTRPAQSLSIVKLTKGKFELQEGIVTFKLDGRHSLYLTRTEWKWLGGKLWMENLSLDPSHPVVQATAQVADVPLGAFLEFFAGEKVTGDGKLAGTVSLAVDWPDVRVNGGKLVGMAPGIVRLKDQAIMAAALERYPASARQLILEAMADFGYDTLQIDLRSEVYDGQQDLGAPVHLVGKGRSGGRQGLDLEIPVHGLTAYLRGMLNFYQAFSGE